MQESNTQTNKLPEPAVGDQPFVIDVAHRHAIAVNENVVVRIVSQILFDHSVRTAEISIAIVDDDTIQELNKQYLEHDYETDVLSFLLNHDAETAALSGEVIVSGDTAVREAAEQKVAGGDELLLYIIHGTLHLLGFDDKDPVDRMKMRAAEKHYTVQFGIQYSRPNDPELDGEAD